MNQALPALPTQVSERVLTSLCNYVPVVTDVFRNGDDLSPGHIVVQFVLQIDHKEEAGPFEATLLELRKLDFLQLDYRCRNFSNCGLQECLSQWIQIQVSRFHLAERRYLSRTGWMTLNGIHCYLAGDQLLGANGFLPISDCLLLSDFKKIHLDIDKSLSARTLKHVLATFRRAGGDSGACAVLYFLYVMLRPLYREAGWDHTFVCYLYGPSQSRKTTFAQLLTCIYNRSDQNPQPSDISLLSTSAAIMEEIGRFPGICRLVDDLYVGASRGEARKREEKVSDIIRLLGNRTARQRLSGRTPREIYIDTGVVCTAEYLPQGYSTLVRCLLLPIDEPIDSECLSTIQRTPLAWPTLCYYFLVWCAGRYDEIVGQISKLRQVFEEKRGADQLPEERLKEIKFSLGITLKIFMCFLKETLPEIRTGYYQRIQKNWWVNIQNCVSNQSNLLVRAKSAGDKDRLSTALAELYTNEEINITKKPGKKFRDGEAAVIHKQCLCLRPSYLEQLMQRYFSDPNITARQVTEELRANGLLSMDATRRSTKKLSGIRAVHIYLDHLCDTYGPPDIFDGR